MELFWELAVTVALSLLLPLIFVKLLSGTPNFEEFEKVDVIRRDRDSRVKSDSQKWETDEVVRIVGKFDDLREKSIMGKLIVPDIVDMNSESPRIRNSDDNRVYIESEVVDLAEETSPDCGYAVDESNWEVKFNEEDAELKEWESSADRVEEVEISQCDRNCNEIDGENRSLLDEDDWEGIERTELEKRFGAAVVFVESRSNASRVSDLSNDVKMKLYGYHRIATQGPCQEPQPMALKFSARAKWNAWQQLGIMNPELAMERYITLLSESVPDWMAHYPCENVELASAQSLII